MLAMTASRWLLVLVVFCVFKSSVSKQVCDPHNEQDAWAKCHGELLTEHQEAKREEFKGYTEWFSKDDGECEATVKVFANLDLEKACEPICDKWVKFAAEHACKDLFLVLNGQANNHETPEARPAEEGAPGIGEGEQEHEGDEADKAPNKPLPESAEHETAAEAAEEAAAAGPGAESAPPPEGDQEAVKAADTRLPDSDETPGGRTQSPADRGGER